MTGFEPRTSGVGSDRSINCTTTTAQKNKSFHERIILICLMYLRTSCHRHHAYFVVGIPTYLPTYACVEGTYLPTHVERIYGPFTLVVIEPKS